MPGFLYDKEPSRSKPAWEDTIVNQKIDSYLRSLLTERTGLFAEIEQYAEENHIPIMEPESIEVLLQIIRLKQPQSILEVGTAIGYSALRMIDAVPSVKVVTIERHVKRIAEAKANIEKSGKQEQITLIEGDALEAGEAAGAHGPYDILFVDAAKGQYKRFFELFVPFLRHDGIIITDNVLYKGLVAEPLAEIEPKRRRALVRKIHNYNVWLHNHPDFDTVILPIGDGVAISKYKSL